MKKLLVAFLLITSVASSGDPFELAVVIPESVLLHRARYAEMYSYIFAQDAYMAGFFAGRAGAYRELLADIEFFKPKP